MTRYDYRQSRFERLIGRRPHLIIDDALRTALLAFTVALCLVGAGAFVEAHRLASLDVDLATLDARLVDARRADARLDRMQRVIANERALRDAVLAARREGALAADTIAGIGNVLPPQTWLTSIRNDRSGGWSIAGRSTQLEEVGGTLVAVARVQASTTPHLVSITAASRHAAVLDFLIASEAAR